ncbi:thioredoxin [Nonlabens marinus S1-08]|uniref:Thioredoxin n=2 Tax=Nonlabens TaxID=363408 RepID=W8VRZ0_9FLAO|nr:thioredoxin [Nonlabens marinus S1-08]
MKYLLISFFSLVALSQLQAQQYITDSEIATTAAVVDDEMKILYFTASWCGPCRMMKPTIEAMATDPKSVAKIYKLDIDENITDEVLNIPGVPTFLFLKNGTLVDQHTGALAPAAFNALVAKNAKLPASKNLLVYAPVPSKYKVIAGSHPKLTKKNLDQLWHREKLLSQTASSIAQNLTDKQDLLSGMALINRAIEIEKSGQNLYVKSSLLRKMGQIKEADAVAKEAKNLMISGK